VQSATIVTQSKGDETIQAQADFFAKLLAWLIDGQSRGDIGQRAVTAAHELRPDVVDDATARRILGRRLRQLQSEFASNFRGVCPPAGVLAAVGSPSQLRVPRER